MRISLEGSKRLQSAAVGNKGQYAAISGNEWQQAVTRGNERHQAASSGNKRQQATICCNKRHQAETPERSAKKRQQSLASENRATRIFAHQPVTAGGGPLSPTSIPAGAGIAAGSGGPFLRPRRRAGQAMRLPGPPPFRAAAAETAHGPCVPALPAKGKGRSPCGYRACDSSAMSAMSAGIVRRRAVWVLVVYRRPAPSAMSGAVAKGTTASRPIGANVH